MEAVAGEIAERLRVTPFVRVVTHIDADGITGGAIASEALDRSGISHEVAFAKKLDEATITELKRQGTPLVWFVDLGAGMLHALHGLDAVITDHHVPTEREVPKVLRGDLIRFAESQDRVLMLNPHLEGEGSDVASGAGCAYAVAKALNPANVDLACVAIVGAVGDVQDQQFRKLSGYNRTILADGISAGVLGAEIDLRLRGTPLRPVLLGTASIDQGEVQVFDNRYSGNRGDIRCLNPVKIDPIFDMDLETKARSNFSK